MRCLPTYTRFYPILAITLLLTGCFSDAKRVDAKREKVARSIPEITEIVSDNEYLQENALAYYWIFRVQAENVRNGKISANDAERIYRAMVENYGLKKGVVPAFTKAVRDELQPWAGKGQPEDYPEGYCDKLMEIAESCRRAAK